MITTRVSEARGEDLAVARALVRDYFASWGDHELEDPELQHELATLGERYGGPDGRILVAWDGERPAGVACLRRLDETTCMMKRMFVLPAHRRRGLASALAVRLIDEARAAGYARMVLDTPDDNAPALTLYRALGFKDIPPFMDPSHGHVHEDFVALELML